MEKTKFLSFDGLSILVNIIKDSFASKTHSHTKNEITDFPDISSEINIHDTSSGSHNDIRTQIQQIDTRLATLADSDDETLDQISEIVGYAKDNRELIEQITTNKINVDDVVDNLTTNVSSKPLSAAQGVVLNNKLSNTETWTFTLADGSTVTKRVLLG